MTNRISAGYKAARTRKSDEARRELWRRFRADCIKRAKFVPSILPCEGGVELIYDRGYGMKVMKFKDWREAIGWIATLC